MKRENWIKWDLDSRSGFKMAGFVAEHGAEGYGVFVWLIELLYRADDHKLPWATLPCSSQSDPALCKRMQSYATLFKIEQSKLQAYVEHLTSVGLLFFDGETLYSPRVDEELNERRQQQQNLSEKRKVAASARWAKNPQAAQANECKPKQADANPCQIREEERRLDKSKEKERTKAPPKYRTFSQKDFPESSTWTPEEQSAIDRWVRYRSDSGHPKLLESYRTEVQQYQEKPQTYVRLVERAIAQGWRGLNPNVPLNPLATPGKGRSAFEQNMAAREELVALMRQGGN